MKIKKCPFCARVPDTINLSNNKYTVVCWCGAESPNDSVNKQGAIRIWNRRRLSSLEIYTNDCKDKRCVVCGKQTDFLVKNKCIVCYGH